jgi:hypothetical protein
LTPRRGFSAFATGKKIPPIADFVANLGERHSSRNQSPLFSRRS